VSRQKHAHLLHSLHALDKLHSPARRRYIVVVVPPTVGIDRQALVDFCSRWRIRGLELFGSALRPDFRPDSDIDILVDFAPDAAWSLFDHEAMRLELSRLLGREVDLVSKRAILQSANWIRRKSILESAVPFDVP
jgi:predicted nucleotidyltransferase